MFPRELVRHLFCKRKLSSVSGESLSVKTRNRISILVSAILMAGTVLAQADDRTVGLLRALSDAPGISGQESAVRKIMREEMGPLSDAALRYDGLGGVVAVQGNHGPRVMLSAHMDELRGVVRRIDANGFISMQTIGGWLTTSLFGQRWTIYGAKERSQRLAGSATCILTPWRPALWDFRPRKHCSST